MRPSGRLAWPLGVLCAALFCGGQRAMALDVRSWACCYCQQAVPELADYDLLVVDPRIKGLEQLPPSDRRVVLAYLSIGEVNPGASLFPQVQGSSLLVRQNTVWGSWMVDIRDPRWAGLMLQEARAIRKAGFDGLFLDTVDTPLELERQEPERFQGMGDACVRLLRKLRKALPKDFLICQNRGLQIAAQTAPFLDMLCLESAFSQYDHALERYVPTPEVEREQLLMQVQAARKASGDLQVLSLDYAPAPDSALAKAAVREARRQGFVPSVNTYALDTVFPPPGP